MPLSRALLYEMNYERSHTPWVGGIRDPARLRDRELLSDVLVREEPAVHSAEGDAVGRSSVSLEQKIWIGQNLGIRVSDPSIRARSRVVETESLILGNRATAEELQERPPLRAKPLPPVSQTCR